MAQQTRWHQCTEDIIMKNELPNSTLKVIDNEGHFSLIRNHLEEILTELKTTHNKE